VCSFKLAELGLSGANRSYPHLENYDLQAVFFQTLTQFSQGNKVLDAPGSNTDGFLSRDTYISLT
jgi:hypothetical protein